MIKLKSMENNSKDKENSCYDLIINSDDKDLLKVSASFLDQLKTNHKWFKNKIQEFEKKFQKAMKSDFYNKKTFFVPEIISRKSPMTILNGFWGSGKTYFIEQFTTNFTLKKLDEVNNNYFQNIVIINTLKFINSQNIPEELMKELLSILYKICVTKRTKEKIKVVFKKFFNSIILSWTNKALKTNFEKIQTEIDVNAQFEKIANSIPRTIIFLDNIERLGKNAWNVLRVLLKLTQFDNLILVLPMHMKIMLFNQKSIDLEDQINKYIDIGYFNLEQDYLPFLKKHGFSQKNSRLINDILKQEINNSRLSLREVEKRFYQNDIFAYKNKSNILIKRIFETIWNSSESLKIWLEKQITEFYEKLQNSNNNFEELAHTFFIFEKSSNKIQNIKHKIKDLYVEITHNIQNINIKEKFSLEIFFKINDFTKLVQQKLDSKKNDLISPKNRINEIQAKIKNDKEFVKEQKIQINIINTKLVKEENLASLVNEFKYKMNTPVASKLKANKIEKIKMMKLKSDKKIIKLKIQKINRDLVEYRNEIINLKSVNAKLSKDIVELETWIEDTLYMNDKAKNSLIKIFKTISQGIIQMYLKNNLERDSIEDFYSSKDKLLKNILLKNYRIKN